MKNRKDMLEILVDTLDKLGLYSNGNNDYQLYTLKHKQSFIGVELYFLDCIDDSAIYHDTDKLVLYGIMDKDSASELHRKYAKHHIENCKTDNNLRDCIIDYECARFTKPDKPLNAYNTVMKYCPDMYNKLLPSLEKFRLNSPIDVNISFNNWNRTKYYLAEYIARKNIEKITWMLELINKVGPDKTVKLFYT